MNRGAEAEARALQFLSSKGLKLLKRNFICRGGELDLVMREGDTVVVIEVRARRRNDFGGGMESVTRRKQERIVLATRTLLMQEPKLAESPLRFDIVAIEGEQGGRLEWLRGAFDVSE